MGGRVSWSKEIEMESAGWRRTGEYPVRLERGVSCDADDFNRGAVRGAPDRER
jgi:hypothetical protein